MAATPDGGGYWLVGADGGVFSFGDASFYGSLPSEHIEPAEPVAGIAPVSDGGGYWLLGADGEVFSFGDAQFHGSCADTCTSTSGRPARFVGITTTPDTSGFAAAKQKWEAGSFAISADEGFYWIQSATDLTNATDSGMSSTSGYQAAAEDLQQLASLPDAMLTPTQGAEAEQDVTSLNAFFDTPGLYG